MKINKKYIAAILLLVVVVVACTSCSQQKVVGNRVTDGADVQRFDYAIVKLGDKVIAEGKVRQWRDYEDSDVVQVVIGNNYYLTHYSNVVLTADTLNPLDYDGQDAVK